MGNAHDRGEKHARSERERAPSGVDEDSAAVTPAASGGPPPDARGSSRGRSWMHPGNRWVDPATGTRAFVVRTAIRLFVVAFLAYVGWQLDELPSAVFPPFWRTILLEMFVAIIAATSLNLVLGHTGQFSIGHAGFVAIGAYVGAILTLHVAPAWAAALGHPPDTPELVATSLSRDFVDGQLLVSKQLTFTWLGLVWPLVPIVAAGLVAGIVGLALGVPCLRVRGDYLAIVTLGFGEIVRVIAENVESLGGSRGIPGVPEAIPLSWTLVATAITLWVLGNLVRSTLGKAFLTLREDEVAAEAVGINAASYKVQAFVIGAIFAGVAGAILAHLRGGVEPRMAAWNHSVELLTMVVLGGSGSITGATLAAILFVGLREGLRALSGIDTIRQAGINIEEFRYPLFALLLIGTMILRPKGLLGRAELADLAPWLTGRLRPPASAPPPPADVDSPRSTPHPTSDPRPKTPGPHPPLLSCDELTIAFGGLTAVDRLSLDVYRGEVLGLIGPNGAGKTTVFNLLTGVYEPTGGRIRFDGRELAGVKPFRRNVLGLARTFQNIRLFSGLSVLDNVRVARHVHLEEGLLACLLRLPGYFREEKQTLAEAMRLLELLDLAGHADQPAGSLPYGDQRRLEIARALATEPKLLLLDEPAAGMNPQEKQDLRQLITRVRQQFDLTMVLIEHDMPVVMGVCDRIAVLDHGQLIALGDPNTVRHDPKVIEAYLGEPAK